MGHIDYPLEIKRSNEKSRDTEVMARKIIERDLVICSMLITGVVSTAT